MLITVYTTNICPYCVRAKMLLNKKNLPFEEIDITFNSELRNQLVERTRRTSVPQIFIGDQAIGGFDELVALDRKGELDRMVEDLTRQDA